MKNLLLLTLFAITLTNCIAQNKIQVNCTITIDKKKIPKGKHVLVTIIDNTLNSREIQVSDKLLYNLDYNKEYTILFEYEGCQAKSIYFNNYTPKSNIDLTCYFNINLKSSLYNNIFQVAEVYYDTKQKDFTYKLTENYNN